MPRIEKRSGLDDHRPCRNVLTSAPDIGAVRYGNSKDNGAGHRTTPFLKNDGCNIVWNRGAGKKPHRLTGAHAKVRSSRAGCNSPDQPQAVRRGSLQIGGGQAIAVHRRLVERWQRNFRFDAGRKHPAGDLPDLQSLAPGYRRNPASDFRESLVDAEEDFSLGQSIARFVWTMWPILPTLRAAFGRPRLRRSGRNFLDAVFLRLERSGASRLRAHREIFRMLAQVCL